MNAPPSRGTTARNVRVPDDLWRAAQETAAARGTTVSAVILARLRRYVADHAADREAWLHQRDEHSADAGAVDALGRWVTRNGQRGDR